MNNFVKPIITQGFPEPIGAYSNGLSISFENKNLIMLSGQQALDEKGNVLFPNNPSKQTKYIFENISILLKNAGASLEDAVKVVIYVTDMDYFKEISPIRNYYLQNSKPVSTLVEVNRLTHVGSTIEIDIMAVVKRSIE